MTAEKERLEYLRGELRAERISMGELAELQGLVAFIEPGDMELLEAAGVPEHEAVRAVKRKVHVEFDWSDEHGTCYDCGRPAAYDVPGLYGGKDGRAVTPERKFCSVCAAAHAAEGHAIRRLDTDPAEESPQFIVTTRNTDECIGPFSEEEARAWCANHNESEFILSLASPEDYDS